ncbi:hypothetical protein [Massilia sp. CF038]|uniref:hypothetical protein n=1 Tax=Massilia sp. CF038 TaxID=1881045 RepID=UPI0009243FA5|nr:hypothetical protein [Massilia sp. CF038]SHH05959.1 hypothetical protein SAMN05428948_2562 [Massilia sp. CF038]
MNMGWKTKNKNLKPSVILERIKGMVEISEGRVSFKGSSVQEDLLTLQSMLVFPSDLSDIDKRRILWQAIAEAAAGQLNAERLMECLSSIVKNENSVREDDYLLLTSISLKRNFRAKKILSDLGGIDFIGRPARKFISRSAAIAESAFHPIQSTGTYENILIHVRSKSATRAATKALRVIDLQRGIWCYLANFEMQFSSNEWRPINRIRLGQIHTLHKKDGLLATSVIWHEPNFVSADLYIPEHPGIFLKNAAWIRRQINTSQYRDILESALLRYVRALDESDQNVALIKLWGALEGLASPHEQNADAIVRRCSFLYETPHYYSQVLEHLREYRNKSVHAGDQSESAMLQCYQLQEFFRSLFLYHLRCSPEGVTFIQANALLDMPTDHAQLLEKRGIIERAIKFRTPMGER